MNMYFKWLIILLISGLFLFFLNYNPAREYSETGIPTYYIENHPSFFDLKYGDWTTNQWIRKPENLLMVHETFKVFGYKRLIDSDILDEEPFLFEGMYIKKRGSDLLDSLIISYQTEVAGIYYDEFWKRRKEEKNAPVVFQILTEIRDELTNSEHRIELPLPELVNDTLFHLLTIDNTWYPATESEGLEHFQLLIDLGFHESAYNLLYERAAYSDLKWDRKKLEQSLIPSLEYMFPLIDDDTK